MEARHQLSNNRCGGWLPDRPKPKQDYRLAQRLGDAPRRTPRKARLPAEWRPPIRDQGQLGSCTGHGTRAALVMRMRARHAGKLGSGEWGENWDLSPLAIYWLGRREERAIEEDSGCYIRDVIDAVRKYGAPTEEQWPYDEGRFRETPGGEALDQARWHQAAPGSYRCDVQGKSGETTVRNILRALAEELPVVFGFTCFDNLGEADGTGVIPLPLRTSKDDGGHCMCIDEADARSRMFSGPNSWSAEWGDGGRFHLPFAYFTDGYADDAWAVDIE